MSAMNRIKSVEKLDNCDEEKVPKCGVCNINLAYFPCTLCNMPYCNITCYNQHVGKRCLETFLDALYIAMDDDKNMSKTKKKSVLEEYHDILNELFPKPLLPKTRYSEKVRRMIETIDKIPVNTEREMMKNLNKDELKLNNFLMSKFERKLDSDEPQFTPFWQTGYIKVGPEHRYDVQRLSQMLGYKKGCPTYRLDFVPPLATVSPVEQTSITFYNIYHLLAVYSAIVRYYSGEHLDPYALEASTQLIQISSVLIHSGYYVSKKRAVQDACRRLYVSTLLDIERIIVDDVRADVDRLVMGPNSEDSNFYILCALAEIYQMFLESHAISPQKDLKKERFNCGGPVKSTPFIHAPAYDALTASARKIKYYYSYAMSYYSQEWNHLE